MSPMRAERVLVIGLDGGTYDVLVPLAELGVMPNLARLLGTAFLAQLRSTQPTVTPVAWTTFQTGCDPAAHGIVDFRYFDHRRNELLLNHAGRIPCSTLFDELGRVGAEVVSLDLPMTYAPRLNARGIIVGGLECPSSAKALAPYGEFTARMRATGAVYELGAIWKGRPANVDELRAGVARTIANFRGRVTAARVADEMVDWRLLVVQFQALDALQHRLWDALGVDAQSSAPPDWTVETRRAMTALDQCVGDLLELASRRGARAMLVSDHGFGAFRETISVSALLASRALLMPANRGAVGSYRVRRSLWKLRRWAHHRFHASAAACGRSPQACAPFDRRRSVAVPLHGNLAGMVYLNSRRRFGSGPISTPRQYDQAAADVASALGEARHPETRERLFTDVLLTQRDWNDDPLERLWPDLIAIPAAGFHTRHKIDGSPQVLRADATIRGTHRLEGVLLIDGVRSSSPETCNASLRDVAPTILDILGIEPSEPLPGRVLTSAPDRDHDAAASRPCRWRGEERSTEQADASLLHRADSARRTGIPLHTRREQALVEARLNDLGYLQ